MAERDAQVQNWPKDEQQIDFGEVPEPINHLLQQGVVAYRTDPARAEALFAQARAADPTELAVYFCLYKIHTYRGSLDEGLKAANAGLTEAARQAGWPLDFRRWRRRDELSGAGRFALYTLKALAFIHLRRGEPKLAGVMLEKLAELDPQGSVGWPVVAALAEKVTD